MLVGRVAPRAPWSRRARSDAPYHSQLFMALCIASGDALYCDTAVKPQLEAETHMCQPGRLMGDSPETRRTLTGDNFRFRPTRSIICQYAQMRENLYMGCSPHSRIASGSVILRNGFDDINSATQEVVWPQDKCLPRKKSLPPKRRTRASPWSRLNSLRRRSQVAPPPPLPCCRKSLSGATTGVTCGIGA